MAGLWLNIFKFCCRHAYVCGVYYPEDKTNTCLIRAGVGVGVRMRSSGGQRPLQGGSHPLPRRLCQEGGQGWKGGGGGRARVTAFPAWGVELSRVLSGSGWTLKGPGRAEPHSHLSVAQLGERAPAGRLAAARVGEEPGLLGTRACGQSTLHWAGGCRSGVGE